MSTNENVAARTPDLPVSLRDLGESVLEEARAGDSGHAALTLTPTKGGPFKQTLVAVRDGGTLSPERWNGPASLEVISGEAAVSHLERTLTAGEWTTLPDDGAEISARRDLVALLTVAPEAD